MVRAGVEVPEVLSGVVLLYSLALSSSYARSFSSRSRLRCSSSSAAVGFLSFAEASSSSSSSRVSFFRPVTGSMVSATGFRLRIILRCVKPWANGTTGAVAAT